MPYNVISLRAGRSEIVFCKSAAEALEITAKWDASDRDEVRVVSTEGATIPPPRLALIADSEKRWPPARKSAAPNQRA